MVLRFEVNQAEAFRRGINVPKSTCHLDVDPGKLTQEERDLIADRLIGIDVAELYVDTTAEVRQRLPETLDPNNFRIMALLPTYEALMDAIRANQSDIDIELKKRGPARSKG